MDNTYITLSERLGILLNETESSNNPLSIGRATEIIGGKSYGILLLLLSMPSSLPIAGTAFATLFGMIICLLLIQMLSGRRIPWFPKKAQNAKIPVKFSIKMLNFSIQLLKRIERFVHPRLNAICNSKLSYIILLILALILILPFPFTNTPPALTILLYSVGLIEGDGFICLLAALLGLILIATYFFAFYFILSYGLSAFTLLF